MWIWIVVGIVVVLLIIVAATYNSLVVLRNKTDDQLSQIDVQLKRRADLIPNLVETVKGYAKHESSTLEEVIQERNSFVSSKTPEEAIKTIKSNMPTSGDQIFRESLEMAITALKEIQQYRAIGTVEECREAVEKQKPKKPHRNYKKFSGLWCKCGWYLGQKQCLDIKYCPNCGQAIDDNFQGMEYE